MGNVVVISVELSVPQSLDPCNNNDNTSRMSAFWKHHCGTAGRHVRQKSSFLHVYGAYDCVQPCNLFLCQLGDVDLRQGHGWDRDWVFPHHTV